MAINTQEINDQLYRLKNNKKRQDYLSPDDFHQFLPKTLGFQPRDTDQYYRILDSINNQGKNALQLAETKRQNEYAYQEMLKAKRLRDQARQRSRELSRISNSFSVPSVTPNSIRGFNPNAPLTTVDWRGRNLTLNSSVARNFTGFLEALYDEGYRPTSIGSYSNRNIAGTNTLSLHALGLAIDIDPRKNPVTWNGRNITALPPGVGALAARYGLRWGGSWSGDKRDTMHFSVPFGGVS